MSTSSSTGLQITTTTGSFGTLTLTNLGPITTSWSAPSSCYQSTTSNTLVYSGATQDILYVYDVLDQDDAACNPSIPSTTATPIICEGDNCLRAMIREGSTGATAFCASFTGATFTQTSLLPTYASQCTTNPISQISSACSCMGYVYPDGSIAEKPTLTLSDSYPGFSGYLYYSPAACPNGWETAATLSSLWGLSLSTATSAYMCCPSGFTSDQDFSDGIMCATAISSGVTISNLIQGGDATTTPNSVLQSSTKLLAGALKILYQASDSAALAALVTTTTTTPGTGNAVGIIGKVSTSAVTTSAILSIQTSGASLITKTVGLSTEFVTTTTFSTSSSSPSGTLNRTSSGISTGAKAGIAVGVVGLIGCVILLIFFFFRRRGKRQQSQKQNALQQQQDEEGMVTGHFVDGIEEEMSDKNRRESTIQTPSQKITTPTSAHEMITDHNTHELATKANIAESPASPTIHEIDNGFGGDYHDVPYHDPGAIISSPTELNNQYIAPWHEPGEMSPTELDARPRLPSLYGPELGLGYSPEPERSVRSRARMGSTESFATARSDRSSPRVGETDAERDARKQQLRDKISRIKEEKERLQRMQELSSLEEEVLRELNEEEKRVRGS